MTRNNRQKRQNKQAEREAETRLARQLLERFTPAHAAKLLSASFPNARVIVLSESPRPLDVGLFDDEAWQDLIVLQGPHMGHIVKVDEYKHNCGAVEINQSCSCGAKYENTMHGCWQMGHQRPGEGEEIV